MSKALSGSSSVAPMEYCAPFRLCFAFSRLADRERMK
jgi:hypothetical protein